MKKNLFFLFLSMTFFACTSGNKKTELIEYYPISISKLVNKEVSFIQSQKDSACKTVLFKKDKIERNKIAFTDVEKDIQSFLEFDINKAAWQKSYVSSSTGNKTRFSSIEEKLPLKFIDVFGDIKSPDKIRIYFQNNNNLYRSVKIIEWVPTTYYSIYSIQDVKGMDADTLFIKTYLDCN